MKKLLAVCLTAIVMMFAASCIDKPQKEDTMEFDFNNVVDLIRESDKDLNYIEYMVENQGSRTFYDIVVTNDSIWHELNEYIEIFYYGETDATYFNDGYIIEMKDSTYYLNRR